RRAGPAGRAEAGQPARRGAGAEPEPRLGHDPGLGRLAAAALAGVRPVSNPERDRPGRALRDPRRPFLLEGNRCTAVAPSPWTMPFAGEWLPGGRPRYAITPLSTAWLTAPPPPILSG